MAGSRTVFQEAIRKASGAAWDRKWLLAIDEYHRALREFPKDFTARLSLAHALEETGQIESAINECRIALKSRPKDSAALTRIASLLERLERRDEAVATYIDLAEVYLEDRARGKALEAWSRAAAIAPDRADLHEKLAQIYRKAGHKSLAAKEYLALARIYERDGDAARASQAAQQALALDSDTPGLVAELQAIGENVSKGDVSVSRSSVKAQQAAMARLADALFDDQSSPPKTGAVEISLSKPEVDALIARAIDAQTHRRVSDAIACYRKLLAGGVARAEVKFNLGLLYSETMKYDDAMRLLRETASDPTYALASHYELGKCYRVLGNIDKAVEHFLAVTKIVDLSSVQRDQADDLIAVYEELAEAYVAKGDRARAESFHNELENFLKSKGWEDKADLVHAHGEMVLESDQASLDAVDSVGASQATEALSFAHEYLRRGKYAAAEEECLRAISRAPNYLPAHARLAEILVKDGKPQLAREKYQSLAAVCLARGDVHRAEGFYRHLLTLAPNDVVSRSKLINLSIQQGRTEDVLQQFYDLGEDYFSRGEYSRAADLFGQGVRHIAPNTPSNALALKIEHRYAESLVRLGEYARALAAYGAIKERQPDDERARLYVIDLLFRLGQPDKASRELDEWMKKYRARGVMQSVVEVLEDLIRSYPNEPSLFRRLAEMHVQMNEMTKAVESLDTLGELQLSRGEKRAAAETIRQIIDMNPPQVEDYRSLLAQIGE